MGEVVALGAVASPFFTLRWNLVLHNNYSEQSFEVRGVFIGQVIL